MAKKIRFNLILDGEAVRNLEGLRTNFNLDDILAYLKNGVLERWLEVREYSDILNKIQSLDKTLDTVQISKLLLEIFEIDNIDDEAIFYLQFLNSKEQYLNSLANTDLNIKDIRKTYHNKYENLKLEISKNKHNLKYLKEAVSEIEREYLELFKLEYLQILNYYAKENILMIIAILMNSSLRKYILDNREIQSKISSIISIRDEMINDIYMQSKSFQGVDRDIKPNLITFKQDTDQKWVQLEHEDSLVLKSNAGTKLRDMNDIEKEISHIYAKGIVLQGLEFQSFKDSHFVTYIPLKQIRGFIGEIQIFRGETDGYWKDIENDNTQFIILKIGKGSYIRSLGNHGEELSYQNVNGSFPILKGIDYKSNSASETLYYMKI